MCVYKEVLLRTRNMNVEGLPQQYLQAEHLSIVCKEKLDEQRFCAVKRLFELRHKNVKVR